MLSHKTFGSTGPMVVSLHWLGGSARTWTGLAETITPRGVRWISLDLPGFGDSAGTAGFTVAEMRDAVVETLRHLNVAAQPWVLAGHSMGGKIAATLARLAADGEPGLENLRGLFLVSPSPPSPEPIDDGTRRQNLDTLGRNTGDAKQDRKHAESFLKANVGKNPLTAPVSDRAVDDLLRMNRTAFRYWLEHGSNEDWSGRVGTLTQPALIVAGTEEPQLGPDAQRRLTLPHFTSATVTALQGSGHLSPLERPGELSELLTDFFATLHLELHATRDLPPRFDALIDSDATSPQTRALLQTRLTDNGWHTQPGHLSPAAFRILRAVAARVVPDAGFDLAARADRRLGTPDGWRFNQLPPDIQAWEQGLHSLDAAAIRSLHVPFVALHPGQQDELLHNAADGSLGKGLLGTLHLGAGSGSFTADQMKLWFEDVRATLAMIYMNDPLHYARIGYTGFADNPPFTHIQIGDPDDRFQLAGIAPVTRQDQP